MGAFYTMGAVIYAILAGKSGAEAQIRKELEEIRVNQERIRRIKGKSWAEVQIVKELGELRVNRETSHDTY